MTRREWVDYEIKDEIKVALRRYLDGEIDGDGLPKPSTASFARRAIWPERSAGEA